MIKFLIVLCVVLLTQGKCQGEMFADYPICYLCGEYSAHIGMVNTYDHYGYEGDKELIEEKMVRVIILTDNKGKKRFFLIGKEIEFKPRMIDLELSNEK